MISFYSEKLLICVMGGSIMIVKNILLFIITIIALAPISAAGAWEKVNVGGGSMKHVLTDVDGDGHVDSIAVDKWRKNPDKCTGNWATILTGWAKEQWNGSYQVGHASIVSYVNSQRVGDINGDGLPDMVIGTYGSNASKNVPANMRDTIYAAINPGNAGEWFFYHIGNLPTTTNGCEVVDIGDLNKDGYPDILAGGESNELRVYVNPGTMSNDWTYHTLYSNVSGLHIKGIALADFNNDTYTDIVISVSSSDAASGKLLVLLNPHVITDPWTLVEVDTSCWSCMETVTTEDIDGDGNKDIVFANRQHGRATDLSWYRNTGTGWTRNNVASLSTAQLNGFMSASVDLDQDNQLDILCYSIDGGGTFWYKNPSWTATLITSDVINNYAVGDIDNDGDKDIICNGFWYKNPAITPQIGWWKLDNTTGTLAYDSTKAGNDASIFNGIWVDGKIDNGLQFNGASTYAAVKNMVYNKIGQIDQLTVMAWIKTTGSGSAILDWDGSEYWSLGVNLDGSIDTGRVTWITCGATAGVNCLGSIKRVDDGKWHHIAVTYNSLLGKKDIYIDGALDNSAIVYTVGERLGTGVTRYGFIGDGSEANIYNGSRLLKYFNGVIDEPRIIRKVLSPAEIQNQHSRISGCWKFDETNGGVLQDSSGNANYGVATNMDLGIIHVGGKEGNALAFDGVDDYVDCGNDAALSIAKAITVEMWFYPQAWVSGYASHPINKWTSTSDANYVMYFFGDQAGVNNKKICFYATAGGTWQRVSPYYLLPALDTWYHIVWTYADDSGGRLYVNGALQPGFVSSCGQLAVNDANLKIGEAGLNCIIDEAKIHSIVLHQEEINIITSQIKGGWYLNEGSGGYAADISSNNNQGTLTYMDLGTCWVDGKYGKALSFDGINDYVNCGNASSLSLTDAITVEAWFRPHAWPAVASVHPISKWTKWQISDANYVMYFYGPGSAYQKICFYGNAGGTWRALSPAYLIPALDAWYHIAWTYSATAGGKLYINGVLQAGSTSGYGALATNAADFKIGDVFNGAIDEVVIYSTVLDEAEINKDMGAPPATNVLMLGLQQLELSRDEELYTLRCRILDSGNNIIKEVTFQNNKYLYEDALNISDLPAGTYTIEMAFLEPAGQPIQIVSEAYTNYGFQAPAWQGNQIGISTTVPGPWVSMEVIDNSIRCWGRGYAFNNSILPCQITSQNKQMLYAPMQLLGREGGIDTTVSGVSMTWQEQTVRKINCLTQGVLGSFNVSANIAVEYDGFMWVDLHLNAASATTIEKLILEIPMKTEYATLINSGNYNLSGTGALSPSGWNKNLKEKPIFWVGNEDVGMQWFAENLVGWHLTDPTYSVKVIPPNGGEVKVQLNLIDAPISIVGLRTISFGLQFTPVKPKVSGWRNMRLGWEYGSVPMNYNLNPYFILFKYYNYPDANQLIDGNLDRRTSLENLGKTVCTYLALQAASPLTAEWRYYGNEWRQTPSSDIPTAYADGSSAWLTSFVCPNANDYREFYLWKLGGPLQANELYGLYFDWGQARLCNNTSHGCGWYDESSTLCSSYNILGARKLAERIYTAAKEHDPSAIIVSHMSGEVAMPVHGFADIMVDGENLIASVAQDESYYNLMPLDKFRAELTHNWGSVPAFLCEFVNASRLFRPDRVSFWDTPEALKPKRHLMGLIMVHDTQCWPIYGLETEYNNLWTIQDDFGWNDTVEFLPYWNNSQYISITPSDCNIVVSIYKKTGKFMLVPFNNTDAAINATLTVNMNLLGFPPGTITLRDKLTNETFSLIDGVISLPIDDRAFRILVNE